MTALAVDTFNRANGGMGANWTVVFGKSVWNVSGNTAVPSDFSSNDDDEFYSGIAWPNDHYSKAQLSVTGTNGGGSGIGLSVRVSAVAQTYYRAIADHAASTNVDMQKIIAGAYTSLGTGTQAWTNGDTWEFDVQGTTLTFLRSGSTVVTATDSALASGNAGIGFSTSETSGSLDNWEGGDFAAVAQTPYQPWQQRAPILAQ